jgi:hypothetical protein
MIAALVPFAPSGCRPRPRSLQRKDQADGQQFHLPMLRIHGNRDSLLAALAAHWAEQQLQIPGRSLPALRPQIRQPRPQC